MGPLSSWSYGCSNYDWSSNLYIPLSILVFLAISNPRHGDIDELLIACVGRIPPHFSYILVSLWSQDIYWSYLGAAGRIRENQLTHVLKGTLGRILSYWLLSNTKICSL
jgi:hypothetical protein